MASGEPGTTEQVPAAAASQTNGDPRKCFLGDGSSVHGEEVKKAWKECSEESLWYRALPFSAASMTITGVLIYNGIWNASKRFGPFPKLAVAGILGFAVGKASYIGPCRSKFQQLGLEFGPGSRGKGPGWGHHHRHCHHVCEECKKEGSPPEAQPKS